MRFVLKVAYDGTEYAGWQCQKNANSVQEALENAIFEALKIKVRVTGSGRTDAGVHAAGQICHFDAEVRVPAQNMPDCINRFLPRDIRALEGWSAEENVDSSRSAKRKTYCYTLYDGLREMPLLERYAVRVENLPSLELLQKNAKRLEGTHDFKAFCASGSSVKTTVRTVFEVRVEEERIFGTRVVRIFVTGNGFLYNMVRTMTGELLDLAWGKRTEESLHEAFETGERSLLGKTMPAKGLTLMQVEYEE